ncbi:MAG: nuclease [Alkalinema sp. CAN_BIN05]|nr:nuclease [Alkalinema sp. CAN_BIN05]
MVSRVILLDSGPLGLITNPRLSSESLDCTRWFQSLVVAGVRVVIPEIVDYEVRRELLRANKLRGLRRLDEFVDQAEYLPITTLAMRQAAVFWAEARQQGQPTAGDKTIDADVILAAQAFTLVDGEVTIATTNVGHLSRFVPAQLWCDITP